MTESNKRKHERYDFTSLWEYRLIPKTRSRVFKAITINVGHAGFCSYLQTPLSEGQEVEIKKSTMPFSCNKAVVRWISSVDDVYVAGFECK
jgi:hypothetical protein